MDIQNKPLLLDFLEYLAPEPRPYADVMDAWRTSCPRLTIWEDAVDLGFVVRTPDPARGFVVRLTPTGRAYLAAERPTPVASAGSARSHSAHPRTTVDLPINPTPTKS